MSTGQQVFIAWAVLSLGGPLAWIGLCHLARRRPSNVIDLDQQRELRRSQPQHVRVIGERVRIR